MKILILANSDSGLYQFRNELVLELIKDNKVAISVPKGEYSEYFRELGCELYCIEFDRHGTNPVKELKLLHTYKKIIKTVNPDIVFTYTIKPNVYGGMACASLGIPYVANITGLGTAVENPGMMQKVTLFLYKKGLKKAQKVFFQNTENRDFMLEKGVLKGAYDLLPGSGVNLERFSVSEYPQNDTVDFIFVGRIMQEKGINQYFDAAKYITKKYPNTRFHVCGACEPEYSGNLEKLNEDGTIIYHGAVKDMMKMYEMCSCTVHPTYYPEGMSNVLLESSACARPVITTNRSGCREVVDEGVNGYIVCEKDSKDLIEKIEKFLSLSAEERKAMGLAGRAKVEKEFNRQIVVKKYMDEINRA